MLLHSYFLLTSHNVLLDRTENILYNFDSLLTSRYRGYLSLLGQSQKGIELLLFLSKNFLRLLDIVMECKW